MALEPNLKRFHESLGKELLDVKDRVRYLIGDSHWLSDGEHKEAVLKEVISRFLSNNYSIGRGFVINNKKERTNQIDIIIYNNESPLLFKEGDFVIVPSNIVCAIIEVKSRVNSISELKSFIKKAEKNSKITYSVLGESKKFFNGIFVYESSLNFTQLESFFNKDYFLPDDSFFRKVNNISLGNDKFIHLWYRTKKYAPIGGYELKKLSFAYFISNLLSSLDQNPIEYENESLFFPLSSKNPYQKFLIYKDDSNH